MLVSQSQESLLSIIERFNRKERYIVFPQMATKGAVQLAGRGRAALLAAMNSFVVDYVVRQKVGGTTLNFFYVRQFPVQSSVSLDQPVAWGERKVSD